MSQSVIVLGGTGMLGSMLVDVLSRESDLQLSATVRTTEQIAAAKHQYPHVEWVTYDAERSNGTSAYVAGHQWVVNCIGITKPLIHEDNPAEVERAIRVNALWPHLLARDVGAAGHRVLQIATDCVFSGHAGPYAEPSTPDAHDVYGRTKALGEVTSSCVTNLRTSIIGPESGASKFLLEWVRRAPKYAVLRGFEDHYWNGITTLAFAKVCLGIIRKRPSIGNLVHVVPKDIVNKYELLWSIAKAYGRNDITIEAHSTPHANMVLATHQPAAVYRLWVAAGYPDGRPTVDALVQECAAYQFSPVGKA